MKIFYFITKSEAGGAQTQVFQLAKYFSSRGHEVAVMSYPGGWLEEECNKIGVKFFGNKYFSNNLNPLNILKAIRKIKKSIREFKPDLINCHSSAAGVLVRLVVHNSVPTIFNAVGWSFNVGVPTVQKYLGIWSEKIATPFCDMIICNSRFVKDLGLKYGVGKEEKYRVIYNGVENDPLLSKKNPEVNEKIKIIFVARLAEPKDPLMFLAGYQGLKLEIKNQTEVVIVGDGPKMKEAVEYVKVNNLQNNVVFLGNVQREKVFETLSLGDVFALCTKWESFPYTVIEGMFAGLACIASNVGGIGEALDKNCGVLVENTTEQWTEKLEFILKNRQEIKNMGLRGKERALQDFSVEKMFEETEKVYLEILKKYA